MKKLKPLLAIVVLCAAPGWRADAVVFRAKATSVDGLYGATTIKFGHAAQNQETVWSQPPFPGSYAAVAVDQFFSGRLDSVYMSTVPFWAFGLQVWASPGWTYGDVVVKIWAEDISYPGGGWWGAFRPSYVSGAPGFIVTDVGSSDSPLITLTVPAWAAQHETWILLNQNPEPSGLVVMLTGTAGLSVIRFKRRRAAL